MSHNHGGGGGGGMGGMSGMPMGTALFQDTNIQLAQSFWYIIAGVVGFLGIIRGINYLEGLRRLRRCRSESVQFPTRPSNRIAQIWATATAIVREAGHPQLYIPVRGLRWATPPPLGHVLVLLAYWAVIIYMMANDAVVKDAYFWERIGFRNAWVTLMQMPLVYLLSMKVSPVSLIADISHERLNWLHRWVGRTMFVTATVHGFHFWTEWVRADFVEEQLSILPSIKYGLGAWGLLVWTFLVGVRPFRGMAYELFVAQHVLTAAFFLWLVYVHIPNYAQQYLWFSIALVCLDRLARWAFLAWQNMRLRAPDRSTCKGTRRLGHEVQVQAVGPSTTVLTIKDVHFSWKAGQHLYLWLPRVGPLEAHPYTIACAHQLPDTCVCNSVQLVIRSHGGFSKRLHRYAQNALESSSSSSGGSKREALTGFVMGPYGAPPRWDIYETMVLISASTGASFTLPILESIVQSGRRRRGCTTRVEFVLLARQGEEIEANMIHHFSIYESSAAAAAAAQHRRDPSDGSVGGDCCREKRAALDLEKGDGVQLTQRPRSGSMVGMVREYYCRPDLEELIREPVEAAGGETSVVVCGGRPLTSSVRNCVAALSDERAVHKGTGAQGIHLFVEEYSF
ncbi:ferric reductase like transmembrane component [Colletotrichum graminicola M1.001]|uniref:ferric-chelate reductase (NADPH) n=1 Tax=Colletotrichum graminicola (strain M1.001 / M2 / FGSC 10212) TaxID=645133 RepID=E3QPR7_COLGM|nr:ferric reductase like transmembrane component [Colletotrichum graminicola M1.001]EFQ32844.1 ferric reductase like transmembrane component [Colletotrichum graminicola M1.001]